MHLPREEALRYLQSVMPGHKALGLLAQLDFQRWIDSQGHPVRNKYFPGCWIVALRGRDFYSLRTCFFVAPEVLQRQRAEGFVSELVGNRQFQSLCSSLNSAGLDVMYCIPTVEGCTASIGDVAWKVYRYRDERLMEVDMDGYFSRWGGRGRASRARPWDPTTVARFRELDEGALTSLALPQLFYNRLFKEVYRAGTMDPYDADGFIISYDGRVFPIELKEKFPFHHQSIGETIGVDVGRILMMLRICIPSNANAFYIVREVEKTRERALVGWRAIRLDQLLMKCSWNVQAGGPGMASSAGGAGSPTSTILIPRGAFWDMTAEMFSDAYLRQHAGLTDAARRLAEEFFRMHVVRFGGT